MNATARIVLIGDQSDAVVAHRCIPRALQLAARAEQRIVDVTWLRTDALVEAPAQLKDFSAVWTVPASPYASLEGALAGIRFARVQGVPFLGTCGGFQHALIEFARAVAGIGNAGHAETDPRAPAPLVSALACSLVETESELRFSPESRLARIYSSTTSREAYHCNYGLNPLYRDQLESAGLRFTAFDLSGQVRACELPNHPFFIGTLFQPERSALRHEAHPLIRAFIRAA